MEDQEEPRKEQPSSPRGPEEHESGYVTSPNTVENTASQSYSTSADVSEATPKAKPFPGTPACKPQYS